MYGLRRTRQLPHTLIPVAAGCPSQGVHPNDVCLSFLRCTSERCMFILFLKESPGWLVGWLIGWLVGWLIGWLVTCLVGWLTKWLVDFLVLLRKAQQKKDEKLAAFRIKGITHAAYSTA